MLQGVANAHAISCVRVPIFKVFLNTILIFVKTVVCTIYLISDIATAYYQLSILILIEQRSCDRETVEGCYLRVQDFCL